MASPLRPLVRLDHVTRYQFEHPSQPLLTRGTLVKFSSTADADEWLLKAVDATDATEVADAIGFVEIANTTVNRGLRVVLFGNGIMEVDVGTGGATRGKDAKVVADGFTNAAANGGGTVSQIVFGKFLQNGVAGDRIGMILMRHRSVTA